MAKRNRFLLAFKVVSDDVFRLPFLGGTGPDTPLEVPLDPLVFLALEAREFFPLFTTASKESLSREFSLKMDIEYYIRGSGY